MKHNNKTFRCFFCASLMMLSTTAAFAVGQPQPEELNKIIQDAVSQHIPEIRADVIDKIEERQQEETEMGEVALDNDTTTPTDTFENASSAETNTTTDNTQETTPGDVSAPSMAELAAPILALLALILALVALFKSKNGKKRSRRLDKDEPEKSVMPLVQGLQKKIDTQDKHIEALNSAIAEQAKTINQLNLAIDQLRRLQTQVDPNSGGRGTKIEVRPPRPPKETLYASRVAGDCFPTDSIATTDGNYVIAILTVEGDKGTFRINTNPAVQQNLLSTLNYGVGLISTVKSQATSPQRVDTVREGKVEREAGGWKITQKAEVRLI